MNCSVCHSPSLKACGNKCGTVYCGEDCANEDWSTHHMECEAIGKGHWIKDMHMKKGAFKKQAMRHHETTKQYQNQVLKKGSHASATTKRRAQLARTFESMRHKK